MLVALACLAAAGLAGALWVTKLSMDRQDRATSTYTSSLQSLMEDFTEAVQTLVLGYQDSAPSNERPSTEPSENEILPTDDELLARMPPHIQEAYRREQEEEQMLSTRFSPSSTGPNGSSPTTADLP